MRFEGMAQGGAELEVIGVAVALAFGGQRPGGRGSCWSMGPRPGGQPETFRADHWRCRFLADGDRPVRHADVVAQLMGLMGSGLDFIKTEHLYTFDGVPGFSMGQGQ